MIGRHSAMRSTRREAKARRRRLAIEALEPRSLLTVMVPRSGAIVQTAATTAAPLVEFAPLAPLTTTVGQLFNGPVGNFTDSSAGSAPSTNTPANDFRASVDWGDGLPATPTSILRIGTSSTPLVTAPPGSFTVFTQKTFAQPGTFNVTVRLTRVSTGAVTTFNTEAIVFPFTAQILPPIPGGAPNATYQPQPTFIGAAEPGASVVLTAVVAGQVNVIRLGEASVDPSGFWIVKTQAPLGPGVYQVSAVVTPPGGPPSPPIAVFPNTGLVIDDVPPQLLGASFAPRRNQVTLIFRDDNSGMNLATVLNRASYAWAGPGLLQTPPASVVLDNLPLLPTDPVAVTLTFPRPVRVRAGGPLRILPGRISDLAGNTLAIMHGGRIHNASLGRLRG